MTTYRKTELYGGGITVDLPEHFADVSKLRQVPEQQEVYIDKDGFTSIIFEICERVGPAGSTAEIDGEALTAHLQDLVGEDLETVKVWNTSDTQFSRLDNDIPAYSLIATQTPKPDPKKAGTSAAADFTAIILTLLRLEKERTDVLITVNVPHIQGEYDEEEVDLALGKQGKLIGDAVEFVARIWETFKVVDWKLFSEE